MTPIDPASVVIRAGTPADAEAICALIVRENQRPADLAEIERCLSSEPSVVAEADGEVVGMIYARRFAPDILDWRNTLLSERVHRGGVGRRLVAAMDAATVAAGYRAAIGVNCLLHRGATPERAAAARAFWLAMGWTILFATQGSVVLARHY